MRRLRINQPRLTALHLLEPERFAEPAPEPIFWGVVPRLEQYANAVLRDQMFDPPHVRIVPRGDAQ